MLTKKLLKLVNLVHAKFSRIHVGIILRSNRSGFHLVFYSSVNVLVWVNGNQKKIRITFVYGMEFYKTLDLFCLWNSNQNCTQTSGRRQLFSVIALSNFQEKYFITLFAGFHSYFGCQYCQWSRILVRQLITWFFVIWETCQENMSRKCYLMH